VAQEDLLASEGKYMKSAYDGNGNLHICFPWVVCISIPSSRRAWGAQENVCAFPTRCSGCVAL